VNRKLKILNMASAFNIFALGLLAPFYAVFVESIGGGALVAGVSYSIYAIGAGVLIFFSSKIENNIVDTGRLVALGYFMLTIGFFGYLFVENPLQLFVVQAIIGIGTAIESPAFDEVYSKNLDSGEYAYEWGVWESMQMIVGGVSAIVAGGIVQYFGFEALFVVMGTLSAMGMLTALLLAYKN